MPSVGCWANALWSYAPSRCFNRATLPPSLQRLRSFPIPLQNGQALLPHSSLVEVLPYTTASTIKDAPPWVAGALLWHDRPLPLVSLDSLAYGVAGPVAYSKIVLVKNWDDNAWAPCIGLLGTDAPHLFELERRELVSDAAAGPVVMGVSCWVLIRGKPALIPDIAAIAAVLSPYIQAMS